MNEEETVECSECGAETDKNYKKGMLILPHLCEECLDELQTHIGQKVL